MTALLDEAPPADGREECPECRRWVDPDEMSAVVTFQGSPEEPPESEPMCIDCADERMYGGGR